MSFFKMTFWVTIVVVLTGFFGTIYIYYNEDKLNLHLMDSSNFKEEYESLNGRLIKGTNYTYNTITVPDNSNVIYSDYEEIIDIIKNKTGVIYLGYNTCMDCRNIVPVLLDAVNSYDIDYIYYLDPHNDADTFSKVDGKLIRKSKASNNYYALLDSLEEYVVYKDKYRFIEYPSVIFVKEGNILGIHTGTVESHENKQYSLTINQSEELKNIYISYLDKMFKIE